MKFIFEAATVSDNRLYSYQIYTTMKDSYFAEFYGCKGDGWHFHRKDGNWIVNELDKQLQAEEL